MIQEELKAAGMGSFYNGHNMPYFFNQFKANNYYLPDEVLTQIDDISPGILRPTGGTLANYYDRLKPGYGLPGETAPVNYMERYVDMIGKMKVRPKTTYVANIYKALLSPLEYKYWLDGSLLGIKETKAEYVELGNELNIDGVWLQLPDKPGFYWEGFKLRYISEKDYVNRLKGKCFEYLEMCDLYVAEIRKLEAEIRKTDPAYIIKIGLPMGNPFTLRNKTWNNVLRTYLKHDCEVFHIYLTTKTYDETKAEIEKCIVGSKKPVLITEWSWDHGNGLNGVVKNTGDVGMKYYDNFFKDFVAICRNNTKIELICRHQLAGGNIYSVIPL